MPVYMGERYIPGADQQLAAAQSYRLRAALRPWRMSTVRLLSTTWVPNEEWAFDLFEADSAEEIERLYQNSAIAFERVTEAVHLKGVHE
jgi:hypothetical protein